MGFLASRTARLVGKARPRVAPFLDEGETVQVAAIAREGNPFASTIILALFIYTAIYLPLTLLGVEDPRLTVGLPVFVMVSVTTAVTSVRQDRWLVLTDRRVLFFRVHPLRQSPTAFVESHARWAVRRAGEATSLGWRELGYRRPTGSAVVLGFALGWHPAYEQLRRALPPRQP